MNMITFSTLACPTWSIETIIKRAAEFGYNGIELRGGSRGHVQPAMPASQKALLLQLSSDHGVAALAVTAYTSFVSSVPEELQANIDEAKRHVDLAAELGAKYVRVFLGELPAGTNLDASLYATMAESLFTTSEYATSLGVNIAIEPHDNFARSSTLIPLFDQPRLHPGLRVIWDIGNAFAAGENPPQGFEPLKDRIAYVQVKDGKGRDPHWQLCPLGEGDVPLGKAFELLLASGYQGALSVEWEYAWHPELDPPEIALPAAIRTVRELLATAQQESA
jgi:sugar phosphate isomerase/epimerase